MTAPSARPTHRTDVGDGVAAFSDELEANVADRDRLTVGGLVDVLDQRSHAVVLAILMFPSALPIPTGGVTHVLELIAWLVAIQLVIGRTELWLPRRLGRHELGPGFTTKTVPAIARKVRWFERFAKPRLARVLHTRLVTTVLGVVLVLFVAGAFVAPPFSGLDTLPSIGVVVVCLGLVFSDALIVGSGVVIGFAGIGLVIALGRAALSLL
jgi:hypothetical protein